MFYPTMGVHGYYIDYIDQSPGDHFIAGFLGISLIEYYKILKKFNRCPSKSGEYYFGMLKNCKEACDYLEEVFGIMFKLI